MASNDVVVVNISTQTTASTQPSFGIPLIAGTNLNYRNRVKYYTTLSALALDLTGGETAPEYLAAQSAFANPSRIQRIGVGYIAGEKILTFTGAMSSGSIIATINGTAYTQAHSTDLDGTLTALAVQVAANAAVDTAAYDTGTNVWTLVPNAGYVIEVILDISSAVGNVAYTVTSNKTEAIATALNAISIYDSQWYGLMLASKTEADMLAAAAWAESAKKLFGCTVYDTDITDLSLSADTTSVPKVFKNAAYDHVFSVSDLLGTTVYDEASVFGKIFPEAPGSYDIYGKTLPGSSVSGYTDAQKDNILSKNCNCYIDIAGKGRFRDGKVASGELIGTIQFIDWLKSRMQLAVLDYISRVKKATYDTKGIQAIGSVIDGVLAEGQRVGGISPYEKDSDGLQIGGYFINLPKLEDVAFADKADHILREVKWVAYLANSIHYVYIDGTITL